MVLLLIILIVLLAIACAAILPVLGKKIRPQLSFVSKLANNIKKLYFYENNSSEISNKEGIVKNPMSFWVYYSTLEFV
jgi:flagellar basal body-associated protein FliL